MGQPGQPVVIDTSAVRRRFGTRLTGHGLELGPGHVPFPVGEGPVVTYVDRWEPVVNAWLFPEFGSDPGFPQPDIVADLDHDRLSALAAGSQDFVIASHVLEHVANPLALLVDIHRVLVPKGRLVLLLPDRHRTFDRDRTPTPLSHLIDEYRRDVREVDDDHVLDFMVGVRRSFGDDRPASAFTASAMADEIEIHRRRSVHAHVWDAQEFAKVMSYAAADLRLRWDVVDHMRTGDDGTHGDEFGWVLAKSAGPGERSWRPGRSRPWRRRPRSRRAG